MPRFQPAYSIVGASHHEARSMDQHTPHFHRQRWPPKLNLAVNQAEIPDFVVLNCETRRFCHKSPASYGTWIEFPILRVRTRRQLPPNYPLPDHLSLVPVIGHVRLHTSNAIPLSQAFSASATNISLFHMCSFYPM